MNQINPYEIKYVYHISNIRIHSYKRFHEYDEIFDNLIINISNNNDSILIISGDILDTEQFISNIALSLLHKLFSICNIIPIILTNNTNVIQSIITKYYTNKNIFVYHEGNHIYENILFNINDSHVKNILISNKEKFDKILHKNKYRIALYHTDEVSIPNQTNEFDFILLSGHKYINDKNTIIYTSSLIQQDHTESLLNHGITKIDLKKKSSIFIPILNNHGFCTIKITNGILEENKEINLTKPTIKNLTITFIVSNTLPFEVNEIIKKIRSVWNVTSYNIERSSGNIIEKSNHKLPTNITNLHNQLKFIKEYIKLTNINKNMITNILNLHTKINKSLEEIPEHNIYSNGSGIVNIIEIKFNNIMCYGRENIINFNKYSDNSIIGIRGKNYAGKSSILDIILFCLFDKTSRPDRNEIMNSSENNMSCSILFQIGNQTYLITRNGKKSTQDIFTTSVTFYSVIIEKNGNITKVNQLHADSKKVTNRIINSYVGNYGDYVNTTFVLHKNNNSILNDAPLKQKTDLCRILQFDTFSQHHVKAKADLVKLNNELNLLLEKMENVVCDINFLRIEKIHHELICEKQIYNIKKHPSLNKYKFNTINDISCLINNIDNEQDKMHLFILEQELSHNELHEHSKLELKKINQHIDMIKQYKLLKNKIKIYNTYKYITHPDNIPFELLKVKLPLLQKSMSEKFKMFGDYDIKFVFNTPIDEDNDTPEVSDNQLDIDIHNKSSKLKKTTIKLYICKQGELINSIKSGCGLEKMIVDIIFRLSLDELSSSPKINMFVIDEELSYFDKKYLPNIKKLINMIKERYQYVIIISHDEKIIDIIDYELLLERSEGSYGFINNIDSAAKPPKQIKQKKNIKPIEKIKVITL